MTCNSVEKRSGWYTVPTGPHSKHQLMIIRRPLCSRGCGAVELVDQAWQRVRPILRSLLLLPLRDKALDSSGQWRSGACGPTRRLIRCCDLRGTLREDHVIAVREVDEEKVDDDWRHGEWLVDWGGDEE